MGDFDKDLAKKSRHNTCFSLSVHPFFALSHFLSQISILTLFSLTLCQTPSVLLLIYCSHQISFISHCSSFFSIFPLFSSPIFHCVWFFMFSHNSHYFLPVYVVVKSMKKEEYFLGSILWECAYNVSIYEIPQCVLLLIGSVWVSFFPLNFVSIWYGENGWKMWVCEGWGRGLGRVRRLLFFVVDLLFCFLWRDLYQIGWGVW